MRDREQAVSLTGAQIVWECLVREGVEVVFGYPGGTTLPLYDALPAYPIRHVLVRHEQGAAHMADGYARAGGRVGVALATSGPGATNLTTGIANAMLDSVPTVFITGQVPSTLVGSDAFQEIDITGITLPITKHNARVSDVRDLAWTLREAFLVARSGRPGPVLVDVCRDVQQSATDFVWPEAVDLPGVQSPPPLPPSQVDRVAEWMAAAERPVILAGAGVVRAGASAALQALAERTETPVVLTLLGLGGFPASHPLCLGLLGMHGHPFANQAVQEADLLLTLGARFDDRITGRRETFSLDSRKVHVDLDPSEIGKNVPADLGLLADVREAVEALLPRVPPRRHPAWIERIDSWRRESRARDILHRPENGSLHPARVMSELWQATGGEAVIVTDVGQHQMWEAQYYRHDHPRSLITSGGLGTMGFALPAAIGAKTARPEAEVWVVAGDGGFQMTQCELATLQQERLDLRIAILRNGYLGMVRQWQELFYERRYTATPLLSPDFVVLAHAYDIPARRVSAGEDTRAAIAQARHARGPFLLEFQVEPEATVYPMVPPGSDLGDMIRRPPPAEEVQA